LGEEHRSRSSPLWSFLHSPVTSSLWRPNILLNALFSKTLSLRSFLDVRDQISHPYKTTCKVIFLYILIRPASWSSGQSFWLLIMISRVRFPVLPWGFLLEGAYSHGNHGLGSLVELRFKAPPGTSYSCITIHLIRKTQLRFMGVPTSEVGYTSATIGRGDHEVHKGHVVALGKKNISWFLNLWIAN
jgi:hypothetical protein